MLKGGGKEFDPCTNYPASELEAYLSSLGRVYRCHRGRAKQEVTTRQQKDKSQAADRHLVTVPELPSCTAAGSSPGQTISSTH